MPTVTPRQQIAVLQRQVATLTAQRDDAAHAVDALATELDAYKIKVAQLAKLCRVASDDRDSFKEQAEAWKDAAEKAQARIPEIEQKAAHDLISLEAQLDRCDKASWRARGAVYLLLSEQRGVPMDQIPEADVEAVCDRWEAMTSNPE